MKNFDNLIREWENAYKSGELDKLLLIACTGFVESSESRKAEYQEKFKRYVKSSLMICEREGQTGSSQNDADIVRCSFCQQVKDDSSALHGADVAICQDCLDFGNSALRIR